MEEVQGCKIHISHFIAVPWTLAKGDESLVKPTFGSFVVLIYQDSSSSFIIMDTW